MIHRNSLVSLLALVLSVAMFFVPVLYDPASGSGLEMWQLYLYFKDTSIYKVYIGAMIGGALILFCLMNLLMYRKPKNQAITSLFTLGISVILLGFIFYKYYSLTHSDIPLHPILYVGAAMPLVIAILMVLEYMDARKKLKQTNSNNL
jgi:fatty acid desaturase